MIQVTSATGTRLIVTNSPKQANLVLNANEGSQIGILEDY